MGQGDMQAKSPEMMINGTIGARLRRARLLRGWSQMRLGKAVVVSHQQIQKYESGKDNISPPMLIKLADVLGVGDAGFFFAASASPAELLPARYIRLMQGIQRLERQSPAAYAGLCSMVAALVKLPEDAARADLP